MEERMTREHSNEDIDKSLTEQNYFIGCDNWDDMYFSWKDRTKEVDELHPPTRIKSDRITGVLCECPCPWEIVNEGREREFFEMVADHLKEKFGAENFHGLTVHRDEVHAYQEKDGTEKMSMIHCHALVTPYAHWKDKKGIEHEGINGKNWETKSMLHDFNDSLNEKTLRTFGYELNTHGLAMHKSVEQLKREGDALQMQQKIDRAIEMVDNVRTEYQEVKQRLSEAQEDLSNKFDEVQNLEQQKADLEAKLEGMEGQKAKFEKNKAVLEKQVAKFEENKAVLNKQSAKIEENKAVLKSQSAKVKAVGEYMQNCYGYKKPFGSKDMVTYHENSEKINKEFQERFDDSVRDYIRMPDNLAYLKAQAEKDEQLKAEALKHAQELEKEAQELVNNQRMEIQQEAQRMVDERLNGLSKPEMNKLNRAMKFMDEYSMDGKTLKEMFEIKEQKLSMEHSFRIR